MRYFLNRVFTLIILIISGISLSGCTVIFQKGRRVDVEKISTLKNELTNLEREKSDLERAKSELEKRLSTEIDDQEVKVEMLERGLVITFVAEVLFDSGKADLRKGSNEKLDKVARVLNTTVKDLNVGIEGHTDNVPIKHSGWKSNWELSSARALSVLHMLVNDFKVIPTRLSATGFGEYKPVAPNTTSEGRQKNRRVEIVILPETTIEGRK
ncbi:MAG: flagellar motor protein MotB [Candidatus Omnitrophota bacterium]